MSSARAAVRCCVASILIGLALPVPAAAEACACECAVDFTAQAERGLPVFEGRVARVEFLDPLREDGNEPRIVVTFEVLRSWSGGDRVRYVLHTFYNRTSCEGYWFEEGEAYVLVAWPNERIVPRAIPGTGARWPPENTMGTLYCANYGSEYEIWLAPGVEGWKVVRVWRTAES